MKLERLQAKMTGLAQRDMREGLPFVGCSFGLNPRPKTPSYLWSKIDGAMIIGAASHVTALSDFSLSQH